jgi:hypothetical protein
VVTFKPLLLLLPGSTAIKIGSCFEDVAKENMNVAARGIIKQINIGT